MMTSRAEVIERLLKGFQRYYNIERNHDENVPLAARCDYFEHSQKYVISQKTELWSADCEEFLYILDFPHLTPELYREWLDVVRQDGMGRANIGPGHMYSYITPVFVCDSCDAEARKALRRCRIYKSFHFSLHGWIDVHTVLIEVEAGRVTSNRSGHHAGKIMKNILGISPGKRGKM
ncbi:MAG: hypothetical protein LUE23_12810 [Lachnospiraceae bacterium]|nr:hypothetical protein [Lachnospiraceae bacterium]